MNSKLIVFGSIPCAVCGVMISQTDFDNQAAIGMGTNPVIMIVAAHLFHFYSKKKKGFVQTNNFQLNQAKLAFAMAERNGINDDPKKRSYALNQIIEMAKKQGQSDLIEVCRCSHPESDHFNAGERNFCAGGKLTDNDEISCKCEGFEFGSLQDSRLRRSLI
ncbi:MAG TPA: hypothetical protein PKY59_07665 [Pyrinomonadaceae bacterium]|nr:hypothetical protein [Pyrinomonadaceae bacterium]